jgi:hypothetical protein
VIKSRLPHRSRAGISCTVIVQWAAMTDGSAKVEEFRRELVGLKVQLADCCSKVKKDLANLEQDPANLKQETSVMGQSSKLLAPLAVNTAVPPSPKPAAPVRKSSSKPPPPSAIPPPSKSTPRKVSPARAPPKQAKQFPPLVKKRKLEIQGRPYRRSAGLANHLNSTRNTN